MDEERAIELAERAHRRLLLTAETNETAFASYACANAPRRLHERGIYMLRGDPEQLMTLLGATRVSAKQVTKLLRAWGGGAPRFIRADDVDEFLEGQSWIVTRAMHHYRLADESLLVFEYRSSDDDYSFGVPIRFDSRGVASLALNATIFNEVASTTEQLR